MNGNVKIKASAKQAKKVINIVGFIESQMEQLIDKLDEIDMTDDSEEVIAMLDKYSVFSERVTKQLTRFVNE